ncbi:unnamed protein product [Polarella glacialis]|uniref:Amino acid transporter transmembrane domain-containing protein n=1 Tax=Polarella glacialis TaxID=89957 RepID=A0A813FM35_POLGL|nr:unnamed protein product [Polarella glacialis]
MASLRKPLLGRELPSAALGKGGNATPLSSAVSLLATALGTGVLTLPYVASQSGPGQFLAVLAVMAYATDVSLILLIEVSRATGLSSLGAITGLLFGSVGSSSFQLMISSVLFLALTAMQRVVLDLLPMFLEELGDLPRASLSPFAVSLVVNVFVCIACLSKSFHRLRFASGAALACLLPFMASLARKALAAALDPATAAPRPTSESASLRGFCLAPPLLASAFGCHFGLLDISAELQPQHRDSIYAVIHWISLVLLPAAYVVVPLAGVSLFGADTAENILQEFQGDRAMELARGVLSLTNALRMPLIVMPLQVLLGDMLKTWSPAGGSKHKAGLLLVEAAGVPLLLISSLVAARQMHTLARVLGVLGGTCGVLSCYCLPGMLYLALSRQGYPSSARFRWKAIAVIILGASVMISACLS